MSGFKQFILRGNVVDLAVAVVIAAAFGAVVTALVADIITPLIAAIGGKPDFSALSFTINNSHFLYGAFLNAVIAFLILAAIVYYLIVLPYSTLMARFKTEPTDAPVKTCPFCISSVPAEATRCAFCTSELTQQ
jgi:large conductance mechanosensitive channel